MDFVAREGEPDTVRVAREARLSGLADLAWSFLLDAYAYENPGGIAENPGGIEKGRRRCSVGLRATPVPGERAGEQGPHSVRRLTRADSTVRLPIRMVQ